MRSAYLFTIIVVGALVFSAWWLYDNREWDVVNVPPKNNVIVAFGDSLVDGVGSTGRGNDFVSVLGKKLGTTIINQGVPGDTTAQGLARIEDVLREEPGTVIVLLGGNDALKRVRREQTESNLRAIIERLKREHVFVVLLGIQGGVIGDPYDKMYEDLAREYGTALVPNVLEGVIGNSDRMFDQIHPNDSGYAIIADRILKEIQPYLNQ